MAMAKPFFTKKQKAKMRERRKKIKHLEASKKQEGDSSSGGPNNDVDINNEEDPTMSVITKDESKSSKKRSREEALSHEKSTNLSSSSDLLELSSSLGFTAKMVNGKVVVTVPSSVSGKDAKKFRKDARRKLRTEGAIDDATTTEIEFVSEDQGKQGQNGQQQSPDSKSNKKRKKNFPSIQELLQQKKHEKEIQKENDRKEKKLQQIPDEYKNRYVAMDCEMVGIGTDGKKSALARVSLVDWNMNVVLDTYVQVPTRVTDFRTHVSGVSPKHINPTSSNAMDVKKCRDQVAKILQDKVLVGHALSNDLKALLLQHPKHMIRDTAKYRPYQRYGNNKWRPRKLRDLVKEHLLNSNSKNNDSGSKVDFDGFQESSHDSVQDAKATMELFQLVHTQWEKEITSKQK